MKQAGASSMRRRWHVKNVVRAGVLLLAAVCVAAVLPGAMVGADEEKVVVSRPGTVFHRAGSADIRGRGVEKSLDVAMAAGYQPCHVCFAKEASASQLAGASTGSAAQAGLGRAGGNGHPSPGTTAQPAGLKIGSLQHTYLDKHVKDPYEDLETIRFPAKDQGAYSEDSLSPYYPH